MILTRKNVKKLTQGIAITLASGFCHSLTLVEAYHLAQKHDASYQAAVYDFMRIKEQEPQARAAFLPTIDFAVSSRGFHSTDPTFGQYNTHSYTLSASQALFVYQNFIKIGQVCSKVNQANATLAASKQDLILRLIGRYFSLLKAHNTYAFSEKLLVKLKEHLEQTTLRFDKGLIANSELFDAKNRYDQAIVSMLRSKSAVMEERELMKELIGIEVDTINTLGKQFELLRPDPLSISHWEQTANKSNLSLLASRFGLEEVKKDIEAQKAAHYPSLYIDGSYKKSIERPPVPDMFKIQSLGLRLSVPILSGGSVLSKVREAKYSYMKSKEEFFKDQREIFRLTRISYHNIGLEVERIKAIHKSSISSSKALDATIDSFNVGTRDLIDILNAERELSKIQKQFEDERYDYLVELMKLKSYVGMLSYKDIHDLHQYLSTTEKLAIDY